MFDFNCREKILMKYSYVHVYVKNKRTMRRKISNFTLEYQNMFQNMGWYCFIANKIKFIININNDLDFNKTIL